MLVPRLGKTTNSLLNRLLTPIPMCSPPERQPNSRLAPNRLSAKLGNECLYRPILSDKGFLGSQVIAFKYYGPQLIVGTRGQHIQDKQNQSLAPEV